VSFLIFFKIL